MKQVGRIAARPVVLMAAFWCLGCGPPPPDAVAAADHSHAGGGLVTHRTDVLELFVEYPPHVRDIPSDVWAIHLTWLADWQPVTEGTLTLLLRGPGGARETVVMNAPARPGIYTAAPTLTATGTWRADLSLSAGGREYPIPVGQLEAFESEDALPHDVAEVPPGLITLTKEQQWSMPFLVALAEERRIPRTIPVAGELAAPGNGLAQVSTLTAGVVLARDDLLGPGDPVAVGQTLALIAPTSLDDSYSRMRADLLAAEREAESVERLFAAGATSRRRLERARHDLEVAQAALEAIGGIRQGDEDDGSDPHLFHLRSPIRGVVSSRHVSPGQHVEAGALAYTVVNPETLVFVARLPARHAADAGNLRGAWFTVEGGSRIHTTNTVASIGTVIDPATRTLPVRFAVPNPDRVLKVGMLADGSLQFGEPVEGVAVPNGAVQAEDGLAVVYVQTGGESFQRRIVQLGPSDGSWTIVTAGVASGEQVVTSGAYQVKLASLGDATISDHGHPH